MSDTVARLGKLPSSVWTMTEREVVERIVKGWAPTNGVCIACGEGRHPVVAKERAEIVNRFAGSKAWNIDGSSPGGYATPGAQSWQRTDATITGYACACPDDSAPVAEAVVVDPFSTTRAS